MWNAFKGLANPSNSYMDVILMDNYTGNDVPYVTGIGVTKNNGIPRMFIANGAKGGTGNWAQQVEAITSGNISSQNVASATTAGKLNSDAGGATQPIYFSGGKPVACPYSLAKSVPSNAVFTDTNTWRGIQNSLTSDSTTDSLSAAQGKALNTKIAELNSNKILWTGTGYMMTAGHTATLSQKISAQCTGIVLIFSAYTSGTVQDWGFASYFIPKYMISTTRGFAIPLVEVTNTGILEGGKYLYISNDKITGNDNNNKGNNGRFVLRCVLGV